MNIKKITIIFLILSIISAGIYFYISNKIKSSNGNQSNLNNDKLNSCLADDKYVDYKIDKKIDGGGIVTIYIKNKENNKEIFSFQFGISIPEHYHPIELHKCGVYGIRTFGYDYKNKKTLENYKRELWRYKYNGEGNPFITSYAKWSHEDILSDFRIDLTENYVILERGYLGKDDYAIVVKDLNTKEDVFALQMKDVLAKYPDLEGNFGMNEWTKDGKYFWGNIFDGANVLAFFRIETGTWKTDILPAPDDILGGDALNAEKDLITVHPGNVWYGFEDETQQEIAKRRAQGIGTELYIYNLFTKSKQFVASTTEPLWYFKPKWLSDTDLKYEMPSGEKKVYKIK